MALLTSSAMWAADGDTFKANTVEGVEMTFKVISESDKTCQVGTGGWSACIPTNTTETITIPSAVNGYMVTNISIHAFRNCGYITSMTIPNGVISIGYDAFSGCSGLTSITIEAGNTIYDSRNNCNAIIETATNTLIVGCQSTVIPNSVTTIGESAFAKCSLTSITIPNSVTSIGNYAFSGCTGLTDVIIPNSVTSIGYFAFSGCSGLTNITISDNVTCIDNSTFAQCSSLTNITIPNSVTSIGDYAFQFCTALTNITIGNSVTSIGKNVFEWCEHLSSVTIPNSVTTIGNSAFSNCTRLTSIIIGNSVTSIGKNAFELCVSLSSVTIPNSVTNICESAFYRCINLTSINIPCSVTSIGSSAFQKCKLTSIIIPGSVTNIGNSIFADCKYLSDVTISNGVISIGSSTFSGCSGLTSITIPNSVTTIGDCTFEGCSSLTNITIPNSVTNIGWGVFRGCSDLTSITVEAGNTTYDSRDNCNGIIETATNKLIVGIQHTTIPNSVTSIGIRAFYGCSDLTNIAIPNSVTSIGDSAFEGCSGLTAVTIPNSVTNIGGLVFYQCFRLTSVDIPNSVTSIGSEAFSECSSLTSIIIPNSVTSIDSYAFSFCSNLSTVISYIEEPFELDYVNDVFMGIADDAVLYVPAGTKTSYQATSGWNGFTNIKEFNGVTLAKDIVSYTSVVALDFTEPIEGLKAYAVSEVTDGKAVLTEVTTAVPAGTGLIMKGTAGQTYTIPYTTEEPAAVTNKLVGVTVDTEIGGNDLDYILKDGKFVKASAGTLSAGKAYLKLDAALTRGVVEIDGDATGVGAALTNSEKVKSEVYNLQGQRVSKPAKGLYVVDGKKVFVK